MCNAMHISRRDLGEQGVPSDFEALRKQEVEARAVLSAPWSLKV